MNNNRTRPKILLVEDNAPLSLVIQKELAFWGYEPFASMDGRQGLDRALQEKFDLIITDISLPHMNGLDLIRKFRQVNNQLPIIVVTSVEQDKNEVTTYNEKANLFHRKPINFDLLRSQIEMLLQNSKFSKVVHINDLEIDPQKKIVTRRGKILRLSKSELGLLMVLCTNPGNIYSRREIISLLHMKNYEAEEGSVDTLVSRLRRKLGKYKGESIIETAYGLGYRLNLNYIDADKDNE